MGKFVTTQVKKRVAITGTTELEIPLPANNFLSDIKILLSGLGHATQTQLTMMAALSKIELIGDGEVFKRLNGSDCRALQVKRTEMKPGIKTSTTITVETWLEATLMFGLNKNDTENIFPAKLYKDVRVRLEFDATNLGYFTTASYIDCEVREYISDDAPETKNIIKDMRFIQKTATTGEFNEDLPMGENLVDIKVYMSVIGGNEHDNISLEVDSGKIIPFKSTIIKAIGQNETDFALDTQGKGELVASGYLTTAHIFFNLSEIIATRNLDEIRVITARTASTTIELLLTTIKKSSGTAPNISDSSGRIRAVAPYGS